MFLSFPKEYYTLQRLGAFKVLLRLEKDTCLNNVIFFIPLHCFPDLCYSS